MMKKIKGRLDSLLHKKWAKPVIGILFVGILFGCLNISNAMGNSGAALIEYTELNKTELTDSISVKGIVESTNTRKVYSSLSYDVQSVYVAVGDYVTEGAILARLETEDLELAIAQKKEDLTASERNNLNQLQNSQRQLSEASYNLNNGTNAQIVNAQSSFSTAEVNLKNAKKAYEDALNDSAKGINSQVLAAESALETAKLDFEKKQTVYQNYQTLHAAGGVSQEELEQAGRDYQNAKLQYDDAVLNLENAKTADTRTVEQAKENLDTAQTAYDNAIKSLNASKTSAQQELETYKNNVVNSQIAVENQSNLLAIEELEKNLEDAIIYAPISGTVTAVYAKEGESGQGLLFVIEDTENLKIQTYIKEYDVANVVEGMAVIIKSDSTGDEQYNGFVSKIDPAAVKTASGETASSSDVEFGAEIRVAEGETALKIGMNTRMNIILESREDIYCVPFDAVKTNANGESTVFLIDAQGKILEISVTTGLETDFYVEIESDSLYDGAWVANSASGLEDGMKLS